MLTRSGGKVLLDPDFILSKIKIEERMKVADFGCGSYGHFVFPASKIVGNSGKVFAVDILKTSLEAVDKRIKQENIKNIATIWSDMEIYKATRIESESIDAGLLVNTLYQSHKRAEILREAARIIKRGGKLAVIEWENTSSPFGPPPEERVRTDSLKKVGEKLGLKAAEEFRAGEYHYGIIFVKI